jgi:O-antigen ligase
MTSATMPSATLAPASRQQAVATRTEPVLPSFILGLFVVSLVIPMFFHVGEVRLAPFLLVLVVLFVPLVLMWLSGLAGPRILPDYLVFLMCLWSLLALILAHGVGQSIQPVAVIWLQTFGSYLLGRLLVRNAHRLKTVAALYAVVVLALFPFVLFESLTSRPVYLELFGHLGPTYTAVEMVPRWGLSRAQGAFEHPILFGIFSTSLFALVFYQMRHARRRLLFVLALAAIVGSGFLSLSTGALLCLIMQFGLIAWDWLFRNYPNRWRVLMILAGAGYILVDAISNRTPFHVFVDYLTFNSGSAYNRILIWQYGTAEVWRHPLLGIGLGEWTRPWWMSPSMDNFWLVIAVRYGLPALLALAGAFFVIMVRTGRAVHLDDTNRDLRKGLVISLVSVLVAIGSVHLWNATFSWLMFLLGSSVWLATATSGESPATSRGANRGPRPRQAAALHQPARQPSSNSHQSSNAMRAASSVRRRRTFAGGGRA